MASDLEEPESFNPEPKEASMIFQRAAIDANRSNYQSGYSGETAYLRIHDPETEKSSAVFYQKSEGIQVENPETEFDEFLGNLRREVEEYL